MKSTYIVLWCLLTVGANTSKQNPRRNPRLCSVLQENSGAQYLGEDRINGEDVLIRKDDFTKQIGTGYSQTDLLEKISFKVFD